MWAQGYPLLGKYLFGSDGDGGPFSVGEKEEAELGAAPNLHLTALRCSRDLGAMGFSENQRGGGSLLPGGLGAGGRAAAQEGS